MTNSAVSQKQNDLDVHCLQRLSISGFSRTRVKSTDKLKICILKRNQSFHIELHVWPWGIYQIAVVGRFTERHVFVCKTKRNKNVKQQYPRLLYHGHISLLKFDAICPLAIPNQIPTMSVHKANFVNIHWYLLKLSSGNEHTNMLRADTLTKFAH